MFYEFPAAWLQVGCTTIQTIFRIEQFMQDNDASRHNLPLLNRYVQSICGLYSRIARQLRVDRSYVSRVARGERRSQEVERALTTEFSRVIDEIDNTVPEQSK